MYTVDEHANYVNITIQYDINLGWLNLPHLPILPPPVTVLTKYPDTQTDVRKTQKHN